MDYISILKDLTALPAVSGHEKNLSQYIKTLFEKVCDIVEIDKFFNVTGIKKGCSSGKKIMVAAHYDEVGLMVKSIDEKGFIKFTGIGMVDSKILPTQEVTIHGKKDMPGIIGATPPHLLKPEESRKALKMEDLSIDTGMSAVKVRDLISIGDIITLNAPLFTLQGSKASSKCMDNRCSIAAMLEMMNELTLIKHEADVYFVATAQKEVGLKGAVIAAYNIQPDMAIVIDACHGDMPDAPRDEVNALGKGPALGVGPNLHKGLTKRLMEIAKAENIPYQTDIELGDGGTEAWAIQVSRSGIPTILMSIPVRYMHTPIETVHTGDIGNTARLAARFIARAGMEEILCC